MISEENTSDKSRLFFNSAQLWFLIKLVFFTDRTDTPPAKVPDAKNTTNSDVIIGKSKFYYQLPFKLSALLIFFLFQFLKRKKLKSNPNPKYKPQQIV